MTQLSACALPRLRRELGREVIADSCSGRVVQVKSQVRPTFARVRQTSGCGIPKRSYAKSRKNQHFHPVPEHMRRRGAACASAGFWGGVLAAGRGGWEVDPKEMVLSCFFCKWAKASDGVGP